MHSCCTFFVPCISFILFLFLISIEIIVTAAFLFRLTVLPFPSSSQYHSLSPSGYTEVFSTVFMAALSETRLQKSDQKLLLETNLLGILVDKFILQNSNPSYNGSSTLEEVGSVLLKSITLQIG